jgi:hypothetical protein
VAFDRPIRFQWDGEVFVPASRFWARVCDRQLVVGQEYMLEEYYERSDRSHRHYFACIREAWKNLPETIATKFPTPEHLRKRALIGTGFYTEAVLVAANNTEAMRILQFMRARDEFSVFSLNDDTIVERRAISQSRREMGGKQFKESKDAVLDYCSNLVGIDVTTLKKNADRAA